MAPCDHEMYVNANSEIDAIKKSFGKNKNRVEKL
jgi:hypothetical protein